jgi:phage terminase large subunit
MAEFDWLKPDYEPIYAERAKWLTKLRDQPELVPGIKEHYKNEPVDFITDWGMTFDPRNVERDLPAVIPFKLFPRQEAFIDWVVERWRGRQDGLAEKSRDMGVSWLCVGIAVWMWLYHPNTVIGFGSRKEEYVDKIGDPKSLFWKIRQFIMLLPVEFRPYGYDETKHAPHMRIINPENGAAIVGEAGDNIGRGNRTSIYFKDESAFYEHAAAVDAALSQTSNCKIDVSTPNGTGNPFHSKRHGGRIPVFTFHWKDDPRKDQAWYQKQIDTLDPVIVAQEIEINYEASVGDAFIPGDLVAAAQARGPADVEASGPIQLGVDVARFGDDKSVITARRGRVVLFQRVFVKIDTMSLAQHVKGEVDAFKKSGAQVSQIAVDVIGVGSGVADRLRQFYPHEYAKDGSIKSESIVVDVNSAVRVADGENYNLRAQMWANGRIWLENGPVSLPNEPELKADLTSLKYKYRGGLRLIEDKDDAKRRGIKSPDRADSLMLTFAVPCVEKKREFAPIQSVFQPTDAGIAM